jgi:hypothetical protein
MTEENKTTSTTTTTDEQVKTEVVNGSEKWRKVGKFFLGLNSRSFYVTVAVILFESFVLYLFFLLCFKPDASKISVDDYLKLVGQLHLFLLPLVMYWFGKEERKTSSSGVKNGD